MVDLIMRNKYSILNDIACRVRHIASTYSYFAGVRGNAQAGIAAVPRIGVVDGFVINSASLALRSNKESFIVYE